MTFVRGLLSFIRAGPGFCGHSFLINHEVSGTTGERVPAQRMLPGCYQEPM